MTESLGAVIPGEGGAGAGEPDGGRLAALAIGAAVLAAAACVFPAAFRETAAGGRVLDVGCPPLGAVEWLQPASQSEAAPMASAERTLGMAA
ncbi:MAG: hypothetical protein WAK11_09975 [Candidatus Cybelea sp.]